jgi:hypothetical protein
MDDSEKRQAKPLRYDATQYPFCSPIFDPDTTNGLRILEIVDNAIPYATTSSLDYFEVIDGRGGMFL